MLTKRKSRNKRARDSREPDGERQREMEKEWREEEKRKGQWEKQINFAAPSIGNAIKSKASLWKTAFQLHKIFK